MERSTGMYNIFLDDTRDAPESGRFQVARNYGDCVSLLELFGAELDTIDLDYDLGDQAETGHDVLVYMKEHGMSPKHVNVHSDHPEGARRMVKYAEEHFKGSTVSQRKAQ